MARLSKTQFTAKRLSPSLAAARRADSPAQPRPSRRRGLTLVELLVVIAIVGLLVALLMPAVQAAREAARRTRCQNHLHQIGVALHLYHDQFLCFPVGCTEVRANPKKTELKQLAWSLYLLPYLEQRPLYELVYLDRAFDSSENAPAARRIVDVYLCPSYPRQKYLLMNRAVCDYGGINSERISGRPFEERAGVMLYDTGIPMRRIADGTSHTLIVGESAGFGDRLLTALLKSKPASKLADFGDGQWISGLNIFDQAFAITKRPSENELHSEHPSGAHGLLCDGAVRFLAETTDLPTLAALCTRAGAEQVDDAE